MKPLLHYHLSLNSHPSLHSISSTPSPPLFHPPFPLLPPPSCSSSSLRHTPYTAYHIHILILLPHCLPPSNQIEQRFLLGKDNEATDTYSTPTPLLLLYNFSVTPSTLHDSRMKRRSVRQREGRGDKSYREDSIVDRN